MLLLDEASVEFVEATDEERRRWAGKCVGEEVIGRKKMKREREIKE